MAIERMAMKGEELINKILAGERNFSGIGLECGFNLIRYEGFTEMQNYLKRQDLYKNPIDITGSSLQNICATGLYVPYLAGVGADLRNADLSKAYLIHADLEGADLRNIKLWNAKLWRANLRNAKLIGADLGYANIGKANLENADLKDTDIRCAYFWETDLRNVRNLEQVVGLRFADFMKTIVTPKEEKIIKGALEEKYTPYMLIVREK